MKFPSLKWEWTPRRLVALIVFAAFLLRLWAALQLPIDFDEPVYVDAAFGYAEALRDGNIRAVIDYPENREHPPLAKILYGLLILVMGEETSWTNALLAARTLSAVFGTLAVWLLALFNPLAGAFLAVHTLVVKYTSQAYLEALPHFFSLAAVLLLLRLKNDSAAQESYEPAAFHPLPLLRSPLFWLSAAALGLTFAAKYSYLPILFVIVFLFLGLRKRGLTPAGMLAYFLAAGLVFWLFNPSLWQDPISRFSESVFFHARYSQSAHVESSGYQWYQPFIWIAFSMGFQWHPDVFFYMGFDGPIFLLALLGFVLAWRTQRVFSWTMFWALSGLFFLLLWPTKWPQYTLVIIPALCISAASAAKWLYQQVVEFDSYYGTLSEMLPRPPRAFWILIGGIFTILFVAFIANSISVTRMRMGWTRLTTNTSFLPGSTVYALLPGPEGQMVLGTDRGLVFWSPPQASDLPDSWVIYNTQNSGLPHDRILSMAGDPSGTLWLGTQTGAASFDGSRWSAFRASDMGLSGEQVNALALGHVGEVWAGTSTGAAFYDGAAWQALTSANSGLGDDAVFAVAVQPLPSGDRVWFGSLEGVSRLDTASNDWFFYPRTDFDLPRGGIAALLVDSQGSLWMGSLGGGLYLWDGTAWQSFRTSTSEIPLNSVRTLVEADPGVIWAGFAIPNSTGGLIASYNGGYWTTYSPLTSGYSGAEPISMAFDSNDRLWIGTRTAGIDIYQFAR